MKILFLTLFIISTLLLATEDNNGTKIEKVFVLTDPLETFTVTVPDTVVSKDNRVTIELPNTILEN